ncbi:OLC1v1021467C1 [Oldenlandia corymbosa var. corymbosa]|uniref:OLC1v1021467C1 n=1 Tax=Oldenlandia corymbosa var. corymbosa TaxID=529605 RepID=A0AAV1BVR1_OLDCO|nr:OLC1v1021467C1 [Oldenlandia corymbosa var. corymbosa]
MAHNSVTGKNRKEELLPEHVIGEVKNRIDVVLDICEAGGRMRHGWRRSLKKKSWTLELQSQVRSQVIDQGIKRSGPGNGIRRSEVAERLRWTTDEATAAEIRICSGEAAEATDEETATKVDDHSSRIERRTAARRTQLEAKINGRESRAVSEIVAAAAGMEKKIDGKRKLRPENRGGEAGIVAGEDGGEKKFAGGLNLIGCKIRKLKAQI